MAATTTKTKATENKNTTKKVETKKAPEVKVTEKKTDVKETKKVEKKEVVNKEKKERKVVPTVPQMKNTEMKKLFEDNGCATYTKAKDSSNVVYNTFGTKSRILQQGKAYQLLLTNGHAKVKNEIVETKNNDVARFKKFYDKLNKDDKAKVVGFDTMETTTLAASEFPRERTVKITDKDVLVKFIQFMATFEENKVVVAK